MKQKSRYFKLMLLLFLMLQVLTGCWSSRDIEKLDLIIGVGVDKAQNNANQNSDNNEGELTITYQLAKVNDNNSESSTTATQPYTNVKETGDSFLETARNVILKRKNILNGQHQRIIIISSDIAKARNIREILDFFIREPEARMSSLVMVTEGFASEILDFQETEDIPSLHIFELSGHIEKSNKLVEPTSLAKVNASMNAHASFLLQNVKNINNEIKLSRAAVIEGNSLKLLGFLEEEELVGLNWLNSSTDAGIVKVHEEDGQTIIYELESIKTKVTPNIKNGQPSFQVKLKLDGIISEVLAETEKMTKEENISRVEKLIQSKVSAEIKKGLDKIQQEFKVDVIDFHDYVRIKYPKFWKENKKDWDQLFSNAKIDYEVEVTISDYGMNIIN